MSRMKALALQELYDEQLDLEPANDTDFPVQQFDGAVRAWARGAEGHAAPAARSAGGGHSPGRGPEGADALGLTNNINKSPDSVGSGVGSAADDSPPPLWETLSSGWDQVLILREGGISRVDSKTRGIRLDNQTGERRKVERKSRVPLQELADRVLTDDAPRFVELARSQFPRGLVPHKIADAWFRKLDRGVLKRRPDAPTAYLRLLHADREMGEEATRRARKECGKNTLCRDYVDSEGRPRRLLTRLFCRSHREKHCAKVRGGELYERLKAQYLRDREHDRGPWLFVTVCIDPKDFTTQTEAYRSLQNKQRKFIDRLRRKLKLHDLAYFGNVEEHANGWPHMHFLFRSERLAEQMVEAAGSQGWAHLCSMVEEAEQRRSAPLERWKSEVAEWSEGGQLGPKPRRPRAATARCPFASLRKDLNSLAVAAGFGKAGFYIGPVRDWEAACGYMVKWEDDPSAVAGRVAGELSKTRQNPGRYAGLPLHFRRWRPSGKRGDGKLTSFFLDEPKARPEHSDEQLINVGILSGPPVHSSLETRRPSSQSPTRQERDSGDLDRLVALLKEQGSESDLEVYRLDMRGEKKTRILKSGKPKLEYPRVRTRASWSLDPPVAAGANEPPSGAAPIAAAPNPELPPLPEWEACNSAPAGIGGKQLRIGFGQSG